jgi:parvulin-like peptidyl-prolyl isomerase
MNKHKPHVSRLGRSALAATLFLCCAAQGHGICQAADGNRIIAIVNNDIITQGELKSRVEDVIRMSQVRPVSGEQAQEVQRVVLERLIEQRLILQEGKRLEVKVTDEDVAAKLADIKERIGSEEAFEQWMTESEMSMAELKSSIHDQILAQRTIDTKVRSSIVVSPQEVSEALKETTLSKAPDQVMAFHILVRTGTSRTEEEARLRMAEIQQKLSAGESFEGLARTYSDDPQAEVGGKLGWVTPGQLLPELDEALFALSPGEVSQPIQTGLGLHLLQAEQRKDGAALSELDANHAAFKQIYEQKFQAALKAWLEGLKKQAYIEFPQG